MCVVQALAAHLPTCRPYLRAYVPKIVRLPTDWLAIADMYTQLSDGSTLRSSLPAALRKALADTFSKFSEYQLGKYNKTRSAARQKKKAQKAGVPVAPVDKFTLKRLARTLHVSQPHDLVMKLLGKPCVVGCAASLCLVLVGLPWLVDASVGTRKPGQNSRQVGFRVASTLGWRASV